MIKKHKEDLFTPDAEFVCIRYLYCSICGGDYSTYLGRRNIYPISLGHEWVGEVIDFGEKVTTFSIGDLVISDFNFRCGKCSYCQANQSHLCIRNNDSLFTNRGFSNYANIHYKYLYHIPIIEWLPRACLIEPLSCVLHAISMINLSKNEPLLILGGGSIGMLFCFYLTRVLCFNQVFVCENNSNRLENLINNFRIRPCISTVANTFDIVIDCSNSIQGCSNALYASKPRGQVCIMSHLYGLNTSFIYEQICKKELNAIFPLRNGETQNIKNAMELIQNKWKSSDDNMLEIFNDIELAFKCKNNSAGNKQIINMVSTIFEDE
ncbi:alcohol dehydrogenase catalytic domain-containing protein [Anaerosporobacter sp.]|uniref:alcohol dehydrogenase catalytic domain-containing protein n=1 Tax=Anaerosporobacter sp. TaxID=1872529 RepID=UPI00286F774E|nr:alcohol dehydrogenase catalytic domain-containing protein [Anaerosporobacter sp.]